MRTSTHIVYHGMRQRCNNPNATGYERYGGRGIKVCKRWNLFKNFLEDMGERPSLNHSIDRKDNDGNYKKSNCRWATRLEQNNNKRNSLTKEEKENYTKLYYERNKEKKKQYYQENKVKIKKYQKQYYQQNRK